MPEVTEAAEAPQVEVKEPAKAEKTGKKAADAFAGMTSEQMMELLLKFQSSSNNQLAEAILKLREAPVDAKQVANEEFQRKQDRAQRVRLEQAVKMAQDQCPHLAGCNSLSDQVDLLGRSCIAWHTSDSTETYGLCTNCQRQFHENDPDYAKWRRMPSINKQSRAGERFFADPMKARAIARGELPSN